MRRIQTLKSIQIGALVAENDYFSLDTCFPSTGCTVTASVRTIVVQPDNEVIWDGTNVKWSFSATRGPFRIILSVYIRLTFMGKPINMPA